MISLSFHIIIFTYHQQTGRNGDEFSEVCPANWKPGKKTFKPTFDNASKYIIEELNNDKNKES